MLKHKGAFGSGVPARFPNEEEIEDFMARHGLTEPVETYGDGSLTTPTLWWAALGGYGIWFPDWPETPGQEKGMRGGAIGQTGSSTRQELSAWIVAMTMLVWIRFASDSASLIAKASKMIDAAKEMARNAHLPDDAVRNPFKKSWGQQRDGDLWQAAWLASRMRGEWGAELQTSQRA
jgi:hypothetical protein